MDFRLFGEISVAVDGAIHRLPSGRAGTILALLLLDPGRPVSTDRLIDEIWGSQPTGDPAHTLRVAVSRLRSALPPSGTDGGVIETTAGGYVARVERSAVDILRFEDLVSAARQATDDSEVIAATEKAMDLWRNPPMASAGDSEALDIARRTLTEAHGDALDLWAGAAVRAGRYQHVTARLERTIDDHLYREHLWVHYATALFHEGRQVDATRTLRRARSVLADVGLDIGPGFADVESGILAGTLEPRYRPQPAGNIPASVDSFVGREGELVEVGEAIDRARLITLVGPGGSGKTRLAVEFARRWMVDGVAWVVDLAATTTADSLLETAAATLGVGQHTSAGPLTSIVEQIGSSDTLIVMDNCEHVLEAAATTIGEFLARCPNLRVIATSREPLRAPGETVVVVRSLPVPEAHATASDTEVVDAVRLFIDRARAADTRFSPREGDLEAIGRIVRALDGIPLAIELAAVRTRALPVIEISNRMDDALTTLGAGPRTALPRHRTMRAAIEWGASLLTENERSLFRRLAVFLSDFDFEVAAAVSGLGRPDTEIAIDGLVEKSMLVRLRQDERRYRILEPLRQFAEEELTDSGERAEVVSRRDAFYSELLTAAGAGRGKEDPSWLGRIRADRPNLIVSAESLLERDPVAGAAMVDVMAGFWMSLGWYSEGRRLIGSALDADGLPPERRLSLITNGGMLAVHQGDYAGAEMLMTSALEESSSRGDDIGKSGVMNVIGSLHAERGDMRTATRWLEDAIEACGRAVPAAMAPTVNLGAVAAWRGEADAAREMADRADALTADDPTTVIAHYTDLVRAIGARIDGDLPAAARLAEQAIAGFVERRSEFHIGVARVERAIIALELGDHVRADDLSRQILDAEDPGRSPVLPRTRARLVRARVAIMSGHSDDALADLSSALTESLATGTVWGIVEAAEVAAELLAARDAISNSSRLLAAATRLRDELELARDPWERQRYEQTSTESTKHSPDLSSATAIAELIESSLGISTG